MKNLKIIGVIIGIIFLSCACSKESEQDEKIKDIEIVIETDENNNFNEKEKIAPSKEEVYEKRIEALRGMSEDEIKSLTEYIKTANLLFEHANMYDDFFEKLSDPEHLNWNYFEETGLIQIGWSFEGDVNYDESLGITYNEFLDKYGNPVMAYNDYCGNDFINDLKEKKKKLRNDVLYQDFDSLIDNMRLAMETHDVEYIKNIYYILHDMDYFLLRYSPEDVAPYVSDVSTIAKYYGVLDVYK